MQSVKITIFDSISTEKSSSVVFLGLLLSSFFFWGGGLGSARGVIGHGQ